MESCGGDMDFNKLTGLQSLFANREGPGCDRWLDIVDDHCQELRRFYYQCWRADMGKESTTTTTVNFLGKAYELPDYRIFKSDRFDF